MDLQIREEEARLSASLFKNTEKGAPYTLKNANKALRTRIKLGAGLNKYHKHISAKEKESRAKIREFYKNAYGADSPRYAEAVKNDIATLTPEKFVTNEKTLCTKVKISKKGANEKQKKIERAYEKNLIDAKRAQLSLLSYIYEWYYKYKKPLTWRTFEKKMKQTKFRTETESEFKEYIGR